MPRQAATPSQQAMIASDMLGLDPTLAFILALARALLRYGMAAYRVEDALTRVAHALDLSINVFCTPTALILSLQDGDDVRTRVVRVEPGATNLEKLSELYDIVTQVEQRRLAPIDAAARIDAVLDAPERYGGWINAMGYGLVAACATIALTGDREDFLGAGLLGLIVGTLSSLSKRLDPLARLLPLLSATCVAGGATLLRAWYPQTHAGVVLIAALVVLLPGLTLTTATVELATLHLVAGVSRFAAAVVTFLQLGFGVALGKALTEQVARPVAQPGHDLPSVSHVLASVGVAAGFVVLLRVRPRDALLVALAVALATLVGHQASSAFGPEIGAFLGSFVVSAVAHLYARIRSRPTHMIMIPGLLTLVPGSVGFLSIRSLLEHQVDEAIGTGFRMFLVATALACGILVATITVPPRRAF